MTAKYQLYAEHVTDGRIFCGWYDTLDDVRDRFVRSNCPEICQGPGWNAAYTPVVVGPDGTARPLLMERTPWAAEVNRQLAEHGKIKDRRHRDIGYPRGSMVVGAHS